MISPFNDKEIKKEKLDISKFLLYRYISIIILTLVYIIIWHNSITSSKIFVVLGMLLSSFLGAFLYKHNYTVNNNIVIITIILESAAYSIFIILSGGFSSPYLWYYINLFIIIMALKPFGKYSKVTSIVLMLLMLVSLILQKRIGVLSTGSSISYSDINTAIAFIVVAFGFYILLENYDKLLENKDELYQLNISLREAKDQSDYALKHTLNVYDALNLFSLSNPQKVIDELNSMIYRTIGQKGCALFKINSTYDIVAFSYEGIHEEEENKIVQYILKGLKDENHSSPDEFRTKDKTYTIKYIRNPSNILLALLFILKDGEKNTSHFNYERESQFYLHLVKIIIHELDIQSMVESYIVSEEKRRIASEIHDTVIQKIFYTTCKITTIEKKLDSLTPESIKKTLKETVRSLESTMKTLRETIYGIEWDPTNENSFENRLSAYIEEVKDINDMDISFEFDGEISILTTSKKTSLYRIICESINNSVRHSQATEISVNITIDKEFIIATIKDNGRGFDEKTIVGGGQGIKNMHTLASLLRGSLIINSEANKGTEIICKVPL